LALSRKGLYGHNRWQSPWSDGNGAEVPKFLHF